MKRYYLARIDRANFVNAIWPEKDINKKQFLGKLDEIKSQVILEPGHAPFLHFEIHGNTEGLVLNSGELVGWSELVSRLRDINISLRNNLFVSLATCYSAYIMSQVLPGRPAPFFGFVGCWQEV